jgi:hypothetical protein
MGCAGELFQDFVGRHCILTRHRHPNDPSAKKYEHLIQYLIRPVADQADADAGHNWKPLNSHQNCQHFRIFQGFSTASTFTPTGARIRVGRGVRRRHSART